VGRRSSNSSYLDSPGEDARILAAARHGVITAEALYALGLSKHDVAYRVRVGRLHRRYRGVYAVGRPDLRIEGAFLAAVLACGHGGVLSHAAAAHLYGIRSSAAARIDVTAPRGRAGHDGIRLHRPRLLEDEDITAFEGIPITTVGRTLLDMGAQGLDLARAMHEAQVRELLDMSEVWSVLARNPTARGARALERASREEVPFTRSGLERSFLGLCRVGGVPTPRANPWVWDGEKLVEVDFWWPWARLIVEVDGLRYHGTRYRRRMDATKTAALRSTGLVVERFTDVQIAGAPQAVAASVLDHLRAAEVAIVPTSTAQRLGRL
jgi:hypothetical protein